MDIESLQRLPDQIMTLLTDPGSNLTAAFVLYAIIGLVLLIVLVGIIMFLMSLPEDEDAQAAAAASGAAGEGAAGAGATKGAAAKRKQRAPRTARSIAISALVVAAIGLAVWVTAGYTTSSSAVCEGCHVETSHSRAVEAQDPHSDTDCASCHEAGGIVAKSTIGLPSRILHFVDGWSESSYQSDYGRVTQSACYSCHKQDIRRTTTNAERGLKMSHDEPLAASATCLDCHTPSGGVVGPHNAGMSPCMRCHNAKLASSECATCHVKSGAAAASAPTNALAKEQIPDVNCGGCHDEKKECDPCHGLRMPHTKQFMASFHARAGVVNYWFEDGRTCGKCHTAQRRPCTRCHTPSLGNGHPKNFAQNHPQASGPQCDNCHVRMAPLLPRDFCVDMCHTPAIEALSPR